MLSLLCMVCAGGLAYAAQGILPKVPADAEAVSLLGTPLGRPELSESARARLEADLDQARLDYGQAPEDVDRAVWVGRRIAYLGRFRESVEWFTEAMDRHGRHPKLLRHRGHRYLTIRELARAEADFREAARAIEGTKDEVEPDGVPNARNQPISSLHSNIWYHLALAQYLQGKFGESLTSSGRGLKVSDNPDRLVSQTYWHYLILRRLGRQEEAERLLAPIRADMDLLENHAYLRLLLVFKGEAQAADVIAMAAEGNDIPTIAFGLGAFALVEGDTARAREYFERATSVRSWPAFGFLAAEAELRRLQR
jgi:tetratricopeptide (TPR) repeat protein